jgi:hypothetical protein
VIDLGSGCGYGAKLLLDHGSTDSVVSVERSAESIVYAREHYADQRIERYQRDLDRADVSDLPVADCATAFEVVEHLVEPQPMLRTLPARRLFASVPNQAALPYDPTLHVFHHRHYDRRQFEELLSECGWTVVEWYGQVGPLADVTDWDDSAQFRTIVVEAIRDGTLDHLSRSTLAVESFGARA